MLDELPDHAARKAWLSLLAKAPEGRVAALIDDMKQPEDFEWLRAPEVGTVMVQGRAGGTGAAFNLGEVTVTRCSLTLVSGVVGHGYVQGRSKSDARAAALVDALMQGPTAVAVQSTVLDVLAREAQTRRETRASKAAATKVDFFTMVRGEDT